VRRKQSKEHPETQPERSGRAGKPSVLVVDDEDQILKLYQEELTEEGYRVATATTGEQALRMAETQSPDVVVLDIKLKDQNGLEILGGLRKLGGNRPIILNSAYSVYKNDFQSWLADAYLVKSSNLDELKKKIKELVSI
jgi:DNA-binding response OmpR family regulator